LAQIAREPSATLIDQCQLERTYMLLGHDPEATQIVARCGYGRIERTPQKDGRLHAVFGCGNGDGQALTAG
jgi:hypothetical protein